MTRSPSFDLQTIHPYLLDVSLRDEPLLKALREETARDPMARMQIAPEQGQFLALLVKLMNARKIIEVGTFTGYSSLCMARALNADGYMLCCDLDPHWTDIARRYWQKAKVDQLIDLRLAPAVETLQASLQEGNGNSFDLAFIDADKSNYQRYYELCLQLIKPNGVIVFDNTLWDGKVADPSVNDEDTCALRALNKSLLSDERVDISLIPMADGITLARKR